MVNLIFNFFIFELTVKNRIKYRNKCVLQAQRIVRGFLARKQHQPRYRGIIKIKALRNQLIRSNEIVGQLKGNKDVISRQANDIEHLIGGYVRNIQNDARIGVKTIDSMYADIITKIDQYNNMIKAELQVSLTALTGFFPQISSLIQFLTNRNNVKPKSKTAFVKSKKHLRLSASRRNRKSSDCVKKKKIDEGMFAVSRSLHAKNQWFLFQFLGNLQESGD